MTSHGADGLSVTSRVCPAADSASKSLSTTDCGRRTAQSAEHAVTRACSVQPGPLSSRNRYPRILYLIIIIIIVIVL